MAALTIAQLRSLVRMAQRGVDGAEAQLVELVTVRPDAVASLLRTSSVVLADALHAHGHVRGVAKLLDDLRVAEKLTSQREALAAARELADVLGRSARWDDDGCVHLDPSALAALVAARADGQLVVTAPERPPGAVDLGFLKALFRECRRCHLTALYVDSTHMVLVYSGTRAHGRFRLALKPVDRAQDRVLLALPPRVDAEADEAIQPLPDTRPSVARRVLDALTAEVGW